MMVLIAYDVETLTQKGRKRLRLVAKECVNYGQRVQNSVFECSITPAQLISLKNKLSNIIDHDKDSIRIYNLGKNRERRVDTIGKNDTYDPDKDVLIV